MARRSILKRIAIEVAGEKGSSVWKRIDVIGDIAVIKKPFDSQLTIGDFRLIAERLLDELKYLKSVWLAASPVEGRFKVRPNLVHLAGERRTETVYKEHGCRFKVDIARVFITPRLSYEHIRVARSVRDNEIIINMFAGAGLFSIIIACHSRPRKVYSIDINENAYHYMVENTRLNRVEGVVEPILGDAAQVIEESLTSIADRVLMPLPELALDYLPYAVKAVRGRGIIHVYLHVSWRKGENPLVKAEQEVSKRLENIGVNYSILQSRKVRPVGPRYLQAVVDVEVEK